MIRTAPTDDIAACHAIRRAVFIEEQGISEPDEWDDLDDAAIHLLVTDGGVPLGTARLIRDQEIGRIGRVAVLPQARGRGFGAALVRAGIDHFAATGASLVSLSAQVYAQGFYGSLGFTATGAHYDDAGIPHVTMVRPL